MTKEAWKRLKIGDYCKSNISNVTVRVEGIEDRGYISIAMFVVMMPSRSTIHPANNFTAHIYHTSIHEVYSKVNDTNLISKLDELYSMYVISGSI